MVAGRHNAGSRRANQSVRAGLPAAGDDQIRDGNGTDTVYGDGGNDTIRTGAGNDEVFGGSGNDVIVEETADQTPYYMGSIPLNVGDTLRRGSGNDTIKGGGGHDEIFADTEDDTLDGGAGDDIGQPGVHVRRHRRDHRRRADQLLHHGDRYVRPVEHRRRHVAGNDDPCRRVHTVDASWFVL